MDLSVELFLGFLILLLIALYYYYSNVYNYWQSKGIPGPKPSPPFGNIFDIITGKHNPGTYLQELHHKYEQSPLIGVYRLVEPVLVLNDLDLIKDVLIKDFSKFVDRGQEMNEKHEPLCINLFNVEPKRWRILRAKLSPIFTSGKLKDMFHLIVHCANQMNKYLENKHGEIVDMREVPARFATDVIGVYAFGLEANALADEESAFRRIGKRMFEVKWGTAARNIFGTFLPGLYKVIGYILKDDKIDNFLINVTKETMDFRKANNIVRNDFIDLLMALRDQRGQIDDIDISDNLLAAQLLIFFAGGFETTSVTMSYGLYELALNQDVQDKLRAEIKEQLAKTNGVLDYYNIKNMKYLNKVYQETLRKHPALMYLARRSIEPYHFAGTDLTIPAKTKLWIPLFGIQRDEKYWPDPDKFDPERFSEDNVDNRHSMAFLALGDGPRNCIGARFGAMQVKVGLVKLLSEYSVQVCEKTDLKDELNRRGFLLVPKNGISLRVFKLKD